jgi:hypothetical protein
MHVSNENSERIVTRRHSASAINGLEASNGHVTNLGQASFGSDWLCSCETQLHAVVLRRVMRSGEHGPGHIETTSGEKEKIRRGESQMHDVDTLPGCSASKCFGEIRPGRSHVVSNH